MRTMLVLVAATVLGCARADVSTTVDLAGGLTIIPRDAFIADNDRLLVALPREQHNIAGLRGAAGVQDRLLAVLLPECRAVAAWIFPRCWSACPLPNWKT